ncbi:hypothetical protein [Pedobacter sp.]|uniref:hypothetical protein n=1 Tax=Pedobacter sp. TaxID=1411316 RepID=UPI003D7F2850
MEHVKQPGEAEIPDPNQLPKEPITNNDAEEFENPAVDPGFEPSGPIETEEKANKDVEHDGPLTDEEVADDDALNYKNDRDGGAYNPKVI